MLSNTDHVYLTLANLVSLQSTQNQRHGAIAVTNGKITGKGFNSMRSYSKDGFIQNSCSCHAEIAALRDMWHNCTKAGDSLKGSCK